MNPIDLASALANHLWQSTVFAGTAGVLALALRSNHARTRHWVWMIASIKFLVPFSLLAAIGNRLAWWSGWLATARVARPELSFVVEQVSKPFASPHSPAVVTPAALAPQSNLLPAVLFAIWICGSLAVTLSWCLRWRRIRAAAQVGLPLDIQTNLPVLSSPAMLEPGVFGIFRPVLLLPEGISNHLAPAHLNAIVAHESCHVRRRDNLAAAIHMGVEAIFWFHPLVWWIGTRLVEERERACDEEVLQLGNRPEVYAESILRTCQFYLESPLTCMSGIAGSDLKKRVVRIMTPHAVKSLGCGRKLLLGAAGVLAAVGPIVFGLMNAPATHAQAPAVTTAPQPAFEVASIKPNHSGDFNVMIRAIPGGRFEATNITLKTILEDAYGVKDSQISGAPGWLGSEHYDIDAKPEDSAFEASKKLDSDERHAQLMSMLRSLLEDRLKLRVHHETRELPMYALVVTKNGPKFHETTSLPIDPAAEGRPRPDGPMPRGSMRMMGRGDLAVTGVTLARFSDVLSRQTGVLVVDRTGLKGNYDFTLKWTPDESQNEMLRGPGEPAREAAPPADAASVSIFTALQEQLGLKLESQKGPVDTIVIDHVEKPSEN